MVLSLELSIVSFSTIFVIMTLSFDDALLLVFSLFLIALGACHSAIILSYLVAYFRLRGTTDVDFLSFLKG